MMTVSRFSSKIIVPLLAILCMVWGCGNNPNADIDGIDLDLSIVRTDSLMYHAAKAFHATTKPDTHQIYRQFLQPNRAFWLELSPFYDGMKADSTLTDKFQDSVLAIYYGRFLADSNTLTLLDSVQRRFPSTFDFSTSLTPLFKRVKKHFPDTKIPTIATFVSGYTPPGVMPVIDQTLPTVSGDYFGLGLHYWMGDKFPYYSPDIPQFMRKRFQIQYIPVSIAQQIANDVVPGVDLRGNPTLIDKCIRLGIRQYVVHALIPNMPDSLALYYSSQQMYWADYYEKNIYKEMAEKLYSKDFQVHQQYIMEKPFTSSLSRESAPRLAEYFGWKVVNSFMKNHPEITIAELVERSDYETIWKESKYKP